MEEKSSGGAEEDWRGSTVVIGVLLLQHEKQ